MPPCFQAEFQAWRVQALVKTIGFGDGTAMNPFKKSEENPLLEGTFLQKNGKTNPILNKVSFGVGMSLIFGLKFRAPSSGKGTGGAAGAETLTTAGGVNEYEP